MTRPELNIAVPGTKNTASAYNENFELMMTYCEDEAQSSKDYVDSYMPTQTGQSGKFLTTNGTSASWGNVDLSGKADKDLSNITQTGKNTVIGWLMPDYTAVIDQSASWGSDISAPSDGIVYTEVEMQAVHYVITLNGVTIGDAFSAYGVVVGRTLIVSKDDVYNISGGIANATATRKILFVPFKGEV